MSAKRHFGVGVLSFLMVAGFCGNTSRSVCPQPGGAAMAVQLFAEADGRALLIERGSLIFELLLGEQVPIPGWDSYLVIDSFMITEERYHDRTTATVTVTYRILGTQVGFDKFIPDERTETVNYKLRLQGDIWKIVSLISTPRVLEAFHREFLSTHGKKAKND